MADQLGDVPVAQRKKAVKTMFEVVSKWLGHTPAMCRKSYVDPMIVKAFEKGLLK